MHIPLPISLTAAALLLVGVIFALFVTGGLAAEPCRGQMVTASWYGAESGDRTASGLHFDGSQLLVAHRTLPLHTRVRVSYAGRSIVVPVEDRGPAKWTGKSIDLSHAVARRIGFKSGSVCLEVLK